MGHCGFPCVLLAATASLTAWVVWRRAHFHHNRWELGIAGTNYFPQLPHFSAFWTREIWPYELQQHSRLGWGVGTVRS